MKTNKEILEKAIKVALKRGWNPVRDWGKVDSFEVLRGNDDWRNFGIVFISKGRGYGGINIFRLLFDLELGFMKYLTKDCKLKQTVKHGLVYKGKSHFYEIEKDSFEYHTQQMSIEKEPIQYLKRFLEEERK